MMAKRLPSILPPFTLGESLETTKIYSVAGKLGKDVTLMRHAPSVPHTTPFRPSHWSVVGAIPSLERLAWHTMECFS